MKFKASLFLIATILFVIGCSAPSGKTETNGGDAPSNQTKSSTVSLTPVWSTDSLLVTAESAIYDQDRNIIYVSNINEDPWAMDGNGFISKVNLDGEIVAERWIAELNGPKGMGIVEDALFVTDNDAVVEIDITSGSIIRRITCSDEDAKLNDITVSEEGAVYISGSESSKVYVLEGDALQVFAEGDYERPNGLLVEANRLLILSFNGAALSEINLQTKELTRLADGIGKADGIIKLSDELGYITSSWSGQVFHISPAYEVSKLLDTEQDDIGAADIEYIAKENLLLVPTFYDNRLMAYRVEIN